MCSIAGRELVPLCGASRTPPPTNIGFQYKKGAALTDSALSIAFQSKKLLLDLGNNAGTNGVAALADSETQALFHGDGGDQLNVHIDVVAGHAHLLSLIHI